MRRNTRGVLNGIIAAASYGTNPLFALPLYSAGLSVNSVLFYRYAIAVVLYGVWIKFIKRNSLKLSFIEIFSLFILGILFSLSSLTLFQSFKYIDVGIACTILFVYPLLVAIIMALFFREKMTKSVIVSILFTIIGITLLYNGKSEITLNLYGVLMVLLSALAYAVYIVAVKQINAIKHMKPDKLSFYVMLFGLLIYIYNLNFCTKLQIPNNAYAWLCILGLAFIPTIISIETINIAIKLIGSTTTSILGALEPLTAIFFGVTFFNEQLTFRVIIGIILVLSGVIIAILRKYK